MYTNDGIVACKYIIQTISADLSNTSAMEPTQMIFIQYLNKYRNLTILVILYKKNKAGCFLKLFLYQTVKLIDLKKKKSNFYHLLYNFRAYEKQQRAITHKFSVLILTSVYGLSLHVSFLSITCRLVHNYH